MLVDDTRGRCEYAPTPGFEGVRFQRTRGRSAFHRSPVTDPLSKRVPCAPRPSPWGSERATLRGLALPAQTSRGGDYLRIVSILRRLPQCSPRRSEGTTLRDNRLGERQRLSAGRERLHFEHGVLLHCLRQRGP